MSDDTKMMNQVAPYPHILASLVKRIKYKSGWTFDLVDMDRGQGSEGLTLRILLSCTDSYHPEYKDMFRVLHFMLVPPAAFNEQSWRRWLFEQILLVERHEACEFFMLDGLRPYAPHHGPGNDPYIVFEQGTAEEAQTTYLGQHFDLPKRDPDLNSAPIPQEE